MAKRPTSPKLPDVDVLDPADPMTAQIAVIEEDGLTVREWLDGLRKFFFKSREIEKAALVTLAEAKALKEPTTSHEDEVIQLFVKRSNREKAAALAHWDDICSLFNRFHKALTGARKKPVEALEESATIGNRLHNGWTEKARRAAAAETERLRLIEVEKEQRRIADEAAELERQAVAAEEASEGLSQREEVLVTALCLPSLTMLDAIRRAGYKDAMTIAARLSSESSWAKKIAAAVTAKAKAAALRTQATAVKAQPVVAVVDAVKPDITKAAGVTGDVTRWKGRVVDRAKFVEAAFSGKYGIPHDVFDVDQARLTQYAQQLHEKMNEWPGVEAIDTTRIQ